MSQQASETASSSSNEKSSSSMNIESERTSLRAPYKFLIKIQLDMPLVVLNNTSKFQNI
jgi:hypothetical protein